MVPAVAKKSTPEQTYTKLYRLAHDKAAPEHERESAKRKMAAWLKRHGKTEQDHPEIFTKAAADELAQQPPPPPSDPRDDAPHPFDDPEFTPAGLVEEIVAKYLTMEPYVRIIYVLYIIFTHVYQRFTIAPRVALVSEDPRFWKKHRLGSRAASSAPAEPGVLRYWCSNR